MRRYNRPLFCLIIAATLAGGCNRTTTVSSNYAPAAGEKPQVEVVEASAADVNKVCGACHAMPQPHTFPRASWKEQVHTAYHTFMKASPLKFKPVEEAAVLAYYEKRAPVELPMHKRTVPDRPPSVDFKPTPYYLPQEYGTDKPMVPWASNVNLVNLSDPKLKDLLICNMHMDEATDRSGQVWLLQPYLPDRQLKMLAEVRQPSHTEVGDLNQDGILDVMVANLGKLNPTEEKLGSVVWLRGTKEGEYKPVTLLKDVGRVTDVRMGDFSGDGKPDLMVAVFGWRTIGEIIYLENKTTDWNRPNFINRVIDPRHGTLSIPTVDFNKDGRLDFVALIAQEHETVVLFLNAGKGKFTKKIIHVANDPGYGSSSIQLLDFNFDGRLDVLYSNGDVFDPPIELRPDNGIQWLENTGGFPFKRHPLTWMYGVQSAVAADVNGTRRMGVFGVSMMTELQVPEREKLKLDATIFLDQVAPGKFNRYTLEVVTADHFTSTAGDVNNDGRIDLVTGGMNKPGNPLATVWYNQGKPPS